MILAATYWHFLLSVLFVLLALLLMGVILLQRGRGVGLAGAFGGAGGQAAFGSKTGDVLTWVTIVLAAVLLVYSVILNYVFVPTKAPLTGPEIRAAAPAAPSAAPAAPATTTIPLERIDPPPGFGGVKVTPPAGAPPEGADPGTGTTPPGSADPGTGVTPPQPGGAQPGGTDPGAGGEPPKPSEPPPAEPPKPAEPAPGGEPKNP